MAYSTYASSASSSQSSLSDISSKIKQIDFSSNWSGSAHDKQINDLNTVQSSLQTQLNQIDSLCSALNKIDEYDEARINYDNYKNLRNNLNKDSETYETNYNKYTNYINNNKSKMDDLASQINSLLNNISTSYSSNIEEISALPSLESLNNTKNIEDSTEFETITTTESTTSSNTNKTEIVTTLSSSSTSSNNSSSSSSTSTSSSTSNNNTSSNKKTITLGLDDYLVKTIDNIVTSGYPQGVEVVGDYLLATNGVGTLYIKNQSTGSTKSLYLGSHLGGISYNNGYLYVAYGGTVRRYDWESLLNGNTSNYKTVVKSHTTTNNSSTRISFLTTTSDGKLITGQYENVNSSKYSNNGNSSSDLIVYDINEDGTLTESSIIHIPGSDMTKIQGLCIYNSNGTDYYMLTSSSGSASNLYIATLNSSTNTLEKIGSVSLPNGAEQVQVVDENNLMVIYEGSGARDTITILDAENIINSVTNS